MISLLLLFIGAIAIPVISIRIRARTPIAAIALAILALSLFSYAMPEPAIGSLSKLFIFDELGKFFTIIFLGVAFLVGLFVLDKEERNPAVFYSMLLAGTASMAVIAYSRNILGIFIGLELVSLCFYELCALRKDAHGLESAMKLFFTSIFASALLIAGIIIAYGETNSFELTEFLSSNTSPMFIVALSLIIAGVAFKMGLFPFNLWLPDVYQGAPTEVTAILAGSAKKAGFAAFIRIILPISSPTPSSLFMSFVGIQNTLALVSFATIMFGNIVALVQKDITRMIAYSIIAHAGFIAIGLATSTSLGYVGLLFHSAVHALMAAGTYLVFGAFSAVKLETLDDFDGLGRRAPFASVILTLFLLSLTGIPPLAGFLSKFILLSSAIESGFMWLAVGAIIGSVLSTYFYFLILRRVWGFAPRDSTAIPPLSWNRQIALIIPGFLLVLWGLWPNPILTAIGQIVDTL